MINNTVYQICTAYDLIKGNFEENFLVQDNLKYGNFGLGTFNGLNGEMIIYEGEIYRANYYGELEKVYIEKSPFTVITDFCSENEFQINNLNQDEVFDIIKSNFNTNKLIYAIKINGVFSFVNLRSNSKQEKPYPDFSKILKNSNYFTKENINGTLIGFYFPESFEKINPPGFHFHFIDEYNKIGGHVTDFNTTVATIHLNQKTNYNLILPKSDN